MADLHALARLLRRLGVRPDGVLLVHASLGGTGLRAEDVRDLLLELLGPKGTLVVPTFTPENSDTSRAYLANTGRLPFVPRRLRRQWMPHFDPDHTPAPTMGALAECVRTSPGRVRSLHPQTSFAGLGPRAWDLLVRHHPHCHLGEDSPLARLYEAGAQVLLLRVGFEACSAFHLAEYRMSPPPPRRTYRCVVERRGNWIDYEDVVLDDSDFATVGNRLSDDVAFRGELDGKPVTLLDMRAAVDQAREILAEVRRSGQFRLVPDAQYCGG